MKGIKPWNMVHSRFISALLIFLAFVRPTFSQTQTDHGIFTAELRQEKIMHLDSLIRFTPEEARLFWPIYHQYIWKWEKLMDTRIDLIQANMSNAIHERPKKKEFIRSLYRNDMALTKLQKKYYSRFRKALSPPKANQFMQIEYETQSRIRVMEQSIYFL